MGDSAYTALYIRSCPAAQASRVYDVLCGFELSCAGQRSASDRTVALNTLYELRSDLPGVVEALADELIDVAPAAAFHTWSAPRYESVGTLIIYDPVLGRFEAECDHAGVALFRADQLRRAVASNLDRGQWEMLLGGPWNYLTRSGSISTVQSRDLVRHEAL